MRRLLCSIAFLAAASAAQAADLVVLTAGAFKPVVSDLVAEFSQRTGHKVEVKNDTAGALVRRINGGEPFDVLVLTPAGLQTLAGSGKVAAPGIVPLARVGIGVAVKAGAPVPAVGTVDQFRQALMDAKKVAYIDPAAGGSSGIYLDGLFQKWGIADAVRAKAVLVPGGLVAERLVTGEADLAIHQISEILPVAGARLVGPLPDEIQNWTTYAGAVAAGTQHGDAARAFLQHLQSPAALEKIRARGMLPAR